MFGFEPWTSLTGTDLSDDPQSQLGGTERTTSFGMWKMFLAEDARLAKIQVGVAHPTEDDLCDA